MLQSFVSEDYGEKQYSGMPRGFSESHTHL